MQLKQRCYKSQHTISNLGFYQLLHTYLVIKTRELRLPNTMTTYYDN
jgi:hypothetical protein